LALKDVYGSWNLVFSYYYFEKASVYNFKFTSCTFRHSVLYRQSRVRRFLMMFGSLLWSVKS